VKTLSLLPVLALVGLAACSGEEKKPTPARTNSTSETGAPTTPAGSPSGSPTAPAKSPLLSADLPGAVGVLEAKKAAVGQEVVVFGRVALMANGVLRLVDQTLDYCGDGEDVMEECPEPWDYCCIDPEVVAAGTLVVQAKTPQGADMPKKQMELRLLDLIAVKGTMAKNDFGAVVLVAKDGWYRRERPNIPDYVKFPD
jgi:hypothetical protein